MSLDNGIREKYFNLEYYTEDARTNELLNYFRDSDPYYQTGNRYSYFEEKHVKLFIQPADNNSMIKILCVSE